MRNKNKLSLLKTKYSKVPNKIFELDLPFQAVALYCLFVSLPEDFNPSVRYVSRRLKMSLNTVRKYVKLLEDAQVVQRYHVGSLKAGSSKYMFLDPNKWRKK